MTFVPLSTYHKSDLFKESTLILPTVSIGNVPQLVMDLVIHTFQLERIGFLDDDSLVPVSGIREDIHTPGITVPLEVFQSQDGKWTCIQQRSPTLKGKRQVFIDNMTSFASQFKKVIILTSMDASRRLDCQINGPPFRILGEEETEYVRQSVTLGVPILEHVEETEEKEKEKKKLHLPGSGLARQLYEELKHHVETTLFLMFALEGDNVQDGIEFANYVNTILKIQSKEFKAWTPPKSWEFLFGTPFNAELYQ